MNEALRVIEAQLELVYQELRRASMSNGLNDKTYALLREAAVDAVNLKRKVDVARGWNAKV